jgi:hypothetical protein
MSFWERALRRRWRRVERDCERLLDSLEIPEGIRDLRELCDVVGPRIGRSIELQDMPPRPPRYRGVPLCGLTLLGDGDAPDVILVERDTTWRHRYLVGCHELAHLALGHQPDSCEAITGLATGRVFTRSHFARPDEHAAEIVAELLVERATTPPPARPGAAMNPALSRVEGSLLPTRRKRRVWR